MSVRGSSFYYFCHNKKIYRNIIFRYDQKMRNKRYQICTKVMFFVSQV